MVGQPESITQWQLLKEIGLIGIKPDGDTRASRRISEGVTGILSFSVICMEYDNATALKWKKYEDEKNEVKDT